MKYPEITALVPQGEHFDESAVGGEGVWLSVGHLNNLQNSLSSVAQLTKDHATAVSGLNTTISSLEQTVEDNKTALTEKENSINELNGKVDKATADLLTANTRIQELEGQVKEMGGKSSGSGTVIPSKEDSVVTDKGAGASALPRFDSPDHPANQVADKYTRKRD